MYKKRSVTAIILAAGNSARYGKNKNKNFEIIHGRSVLSYSLEMFDKNRYVDNIIITIKESERIYVEKILQKENISKDISIIIGGESRKDSVYNSIKDISSDIVIVHDGARPLIKNKYINDCIMEMDNYSGVTIGVKSKDTIKVTDDEGVVINTTNRNNTWLIQTPQCFDRKILLDMHNKYKDTSVTDDCSLLEMGNYKVKIILGDYTNIKITTSEDKEIINNILAAE